MLLPLWTYAQKQTEYNRKGDEAMARQDYQDAKIWYEEGVSYCDAYSINQLTKIWLDNQTMRPSMRSLMNKCLNCLNVRGTERDTTAMSQLIVYYKQGIGAPASEELAAYWSDKLERARRFVDLEMDGNQLEDKDAFKEKMHFFVGYQYSIEAPYGILFGGVKRGLGWYMRFSTNMAFDNHTAECNDQNGGQLLNGNATADEIYYFTNQKKKNCYSLTGGMVVKCAIWLYTSIGLGYGDRKVLYEYRIVDPKTAEDANSAWAKHLDASYAGVAADLGLMFKLGPAYVNAGCSTINFKYVDVSAGVGLFF